MKGLKQKKIKAIDCCR